MSQKILPIPVKATEKSTEKSTDKPDHSSVLTLDQISQNIESIATFYVREEQKISPAQRTLESFSEFLGKPLYLGLVIGFIALWMLVNVLPRLLGLAVFDPAPFSWMHLAISVGGLVTATVVVIKQNRLAKLEEQRAHLDLQVNLLTEQKVTKIINLLEELRRDLPMVKDRHDAEATAFQQPTDPHVVLAEIDEQREIATQLMHAEEAEATVEKLNIQPEAPHT